jgi:hypothetical protein
MPDVLFLFIGFGSKHEAWINLFIFAKGCRGGNIKKKNKLVYLRLFFITRDIHLISRTSDC